MEKCGILQKSEKKILHRKTCVLVYLNYVYLYNILQIYSELIFKKSLILITNKPHFSCGYVSCTPIENFTVRYQLIRSNPFSLSFFFFWGGGDQILKFTFDGNTKTNFTVSSKCIDSELSFVLVQCRERRTLGSCCSLSQ